LEEHFVCHQSTKKAAVMATEAILSSCVVRRD